MYIAPAPHICSDGPAPLQITNLGLDLDCWWFVDWVYYDEFLLVKGCWQHNCPDESWQTPRANVSYSACSVQQISIQI